ncbi:hypothetical protein PRK78_006028 [Emydomyces testavorans]|uniref:Uncharacterized protein n=1 Tax=Emydomyces testavorans TaxID=2070801 RepID=A0AAF0DKM7_9EURO|nr:hypothetical protein PRK78_006028 [Emydomyces testavorans]
MRLQKILRTASYAAPRSITPLRTITGNHPNRRCYHRAIAKFLTRNPNGELSTTEIPIKIGDPEEAYIMIPPAIGLAFQAGSLTDNFAVPTGIADRHKLTFFHDTRHFGCADSI